MRVKIAYFVKAKIQTDTILSLFSCSEPASSVGENRVQGPDVLEELTPTGNQNSLLIQSHLPIAGEFNDYIIKRMYLRPACQPDCSTDLQLIVGGLSTVM